MLSLGCCPLFSIYIIERGVRSTSWARYSCVHPFASRAFFIAIPNGLKSRDVYKRQYRGFAMSVSFDAFRQEYMLLLKGQMTHRATLGTDPRGNLTRIDNAPVSYTHLDVYKRQPEHRLKRIWRQPLPVNPKPATNIPTFLR